LIDEWLLRQLLHGYDRKSGSMPTPTKKLTDAWPDQLKSASSTHVRLVAPVDAEKVVHVKASLTGLANAEGKANV